MAVIALLTIAVVAGPSTATASEAATADRSTPPASCPVTIPNGSVPPFGNLGHFPGPVFHGENGIWTSFGPDGTVAWKPGMGPGGGIYGVKFLWYFAEGVSGPFRVTGTRLAGSAPPLRAETAGQAAPGFSPSGLRFPSLGCWRITATAGDHAMSFTIWLYAGEPKLLTSDWTSPTPPSYCHVTRKPSAGVNLDARRAAPAGTVAVGNDQLAAFLAPGGAYEISHHPGATLYPWRGFTLHWWQNQANDLLPLIDGELTASYGGSGNIDYDIGAAAIPKEAVTTPIAFSGPGCWQMELRAGQTSTTFIVWLWTRQLPPTATPDATPRP